MGALLVALVVVCMPGDAHAEVSARSYVQNGLIAQWDGIENAGWGVHDASAAKPVELVSGIETELVGTMPAGERSFTFGNGYLHFNSEAIKNAVNAGQLTVEIVTKETGSFQGNGGFVAFGKATRGFWFYQGQGAFISTYSYHAAVSGEYKNYALSAHNVTTFSFLLSSGVEDSTLGVDGASPYAWAKIYRYATDMTDTDCYLGTIAGNWLNTKAKAHVFSIRVYSRKLSTAEVTANGAIDRLRFGASPATGDDALFQPSDAGETARSYVQDGLLAQWDGIENAGWGVHDASAAKPVELVSGLATELTGTMAADDMSFNLGSGYLKFKSAAIMAAINSGAATIEIVTSKNGAYKHNGGFFAFGEATRGFWLYQQNEAFCNACSYHGDNSQYTVFRHNLDGTNTLSFALSGATTNRWYLSGVAAGSISRYGTDVAEDADCYIGMLASYNAMPVAKVFSIRIYRRTLTPAEIAKNAAIDRRRFSGRGVAGAASYVRSGLIAQWDGAENRGFGLHDISSVHPLELSSGYETSLTNTVPADGKAFILGSGYLKFHSQEIIDALNAGHATVELVIAKNGDAAYVRNGGFVAFGNQTRAFWLYQQGTWLLRSVSYHAPTSGNQADGVFKEINFEAEGTNSLSFLLSDAASSSYTTNGVYAGTLPRANTDTQNDDCFIGLLANYNTMPRAKVFSIRVYDRVLTGAELENNQIADRLRFNLHDWTPASAPADGANARVAGEAVTADGSFDLALLALENGGAVNIPANQTVGTHVLLTNGVAVARGGYTGSGNRGTRVDWLTGPGLLRVAGGLGEPIPAESDFPVRGVTVIIR